MELKVKTVVSIGRMVGKYPILELNSEPFGNYHKAGVWLIFNIGKGKQLNKLDISITARASQIFGAALKLQNEFTQETKLIKDMRLSRAVTKIYEEVKDPNIWYNPESGDITILIYKFLTTPFTIWIDNMEVYAEYANAAPPVPLTLEERVERLEAKVTVLEEQICGKSMDL